MPPNDERDILALAVRKGWLSAEVVAECEEAQGRIRKMGAERSLLDLLLDRGCLSQGRLSALRRELGLAGGDIREIGPYEILRPLGGGASGSVYLARLRGASGGGGEAALVAIKVLRLRHADDPRYLNQFERETAVIRSLDHPNIVKGYESGWGEGFRYFAMEYVDGPTLWDIVRQKGRLSERQAARVGARLAAAIEYLDSCSVAHCDIKPGNVIIRRDGTLKLSDWGSARLYDSPPGMRGRELVMATPNFMPPEFLQTRCASDCRTDLYALGATLYFCLAGRSPFGKGTAVEVARRASKGSPEPLSAIRTDVSEAMQKAVQKLMAKNPAHRPRAPAAVRKALEVLAERAG